ncbi:MAG: VPDSG-CTERM-specific exosortase XrtC [Verrucomicrobiota bacterium]
MMPATMLVLVAGFSLPLWQLVKFALASELYSHILLIPAVSWYLLRLQRERGRGDSPPVRWLALVLGLAGALVLAGYWHADRVALTEDDRLAFTTGAFVLFAWSVCCFFFNQEKLRSAVFPLGFLVFMLPFPTVVRDGIELILQHGSAEVSYWMLRLSGMPTFREGLVFQLPGFRMEVAPECSGIRSSLVLFITSLVAGHLFLRTPWKRGVLALVVIPLGILRNAFRIFVLGQLCVQVGPHMINSNIHHRGGPIFFALSLVPLLWLLYVLHKSDRTISSGD